MKKLIKIKEVQIGLVIGIVSFFMLWISRFAHPLANEMIMHVTMIATYLMLIIIGSLILTLRYIDGVKDKKICSISLQCYRVSLTIGILTIGEGFLAIIAHPPIRGIDILFLTFFLMLFYYFIIDTHIMFQTLLLNKREGNK